MSERAAGQGRQRMFGMLPPIFGLCILVLIQAPTTASLPQQGSSQMFEPKASQRFEPNTTHHTPCLYGSHTYGHGEVVESVPKGCVQLICDDGNITKLYFDNPGDEGCCEFAGHVFAEGSNLLSHCVDLRCVMGQWVYAGRFKDCCAQSSIYDDPHLTTFDGHDYDFHGTCNYTLAQNLPSYHDPTMGVFADFTACPGAPLTGSCLRYIVFQDNPHTIVRVNAYDVFELKVNGESVTIPESGTVVNLETSDGPHPVLAFSTGSCLVMVGGSNIMIRVCRHRADIFAHPSHLGSLYGLSGRFNGYSGDDFTDRLGHTYPLSARPLAFPVSWKTNYQMEKRCDAACPEIFGCLGETAPDPCQARASGREVWDFYLDQCKQHLEQVVEDEQEDLEKYIDSCAADLCLLRENGVNEMTERRWMEDIAVAVCEARNIVEARRGMLYDWDCSNPGTKNYTAVAWTSTTANYITTTTTTTTTPHPPTTIIPTVPITLPTPTTFPTNPPTTSAPFPTITTTLPTPPPTSSPGQTSFTTSAINPDSSFTNSGSSSGSNCLCSWLGSSSSYTISYDVTTTPTNQ